MTSPTRVTVSRAADLLGLVPYLLGFRPSESLVLLVVASGRVVLTARMDLPSPPDGPRVAEQLAALAVQHRASGLVLLGYGTDAPTTRAVVEMAATRLEPYGLLDALYVSDARWWSLMCRRGCCPADGTPYELGTSPLAAEAVYAGLTAAVGRQQIEDQVRGPASEDREGLVEVFTSERRRLAGVDRFGLVRLVTTAVDDFLAIPHPLTDVECARLALLVADIEVRDAAWSRMTRVQSDLHVDLWRQVVQRAVRPWEVAPLCLLGMAAWISGDGALQNCCSDRARRIDPTYSMTGLLDEINLRALPPSFWDRMATEMGGPVRPLARSRRRALG